MQIMLKDENERNISRRTNSIDLVIYAERISRCLERELVRRFRIREGRIWISRRVFVRVKEEIW